MSKHLSSFEQSVKKSLDGAKLPYQEADWTDMENRLNEIGTTNSANKNIRWALAAGFLFAFTTLYFYINSTQENVSQTIAQNTDNSENLRKAAASKKGSRENYEVSTNTQEGQIANNENQSNQNQESPKVNKTILKDSKSTSKDNGITIPQENNTLETNNSKETKETNTTKTKNTTTKANESNKKQNSAPNSLSFSPSVQTACAGTEIQFNVASNLEGSYLWNFGDGNFSNEKKPSNIYTKPGIYNITLAVTSSKDGVIKSNTKPVMVTITPAPKAAFDWEFVSEYNEVPTIKVTNQSLNAVESEWSINNKKVSKEINLVQSFKKKGEYLLSLTVANENGCTDTKYKYIEIEKEYKLLAPKTFSPNNDGKDDTFIPRSLRVLDKEFELSIYSDDKLIYRTNDATKAWNGRLNDGTIAQKGQKFPWVVILYDNDGNKQYYSGVVTVVP